MEPLLYPQPSVSAPDKTPQAWLFLLISAIGWEWRLGVLGEVEVGAGGGSLRQPEPAALPGGSSDGLFTVLDVVVWTIQNQESPQIFNVA